MKGGTTTRTLDLDPPAAPFIGNQTWGESNQRENSCQNEPGAVPWDIDLEGELPDPLFRLCVTGPVGITLRAD